ncbi:transcription factor MYB3-like [Vigna unguiculata]|uniref:Myb proto-oncogene protein n=1 Tax=Vigna unguiculata TaxID=3917 RepID=A0A4D6NIG3_VIGUN|nr:transcription factor MYB3-like [Vigna unguiculata]QCE13560.1 myb proto-oncogene protein [Vigna unguiculata]
METNNCCEKQGAWSSDEDQILFNYVQLTGEGNWTDLPQRAGLKRCGENCKHRWLNYLKPTIPRENFSWDEQELIIRLHKLLGNRWCMIAGRLPGRSEDEIKNYWNTYLSKKVEEEKKVGSRSVKSRSMSSVESPWFSQNDLAMNSMDSPNPVIVRPKVVRLAKAVLPRLVGS